MPSDRALHALNTFHRLVVRVTGGHLGWTAAGMPVVELTTTGRRSGQPRTVMLTSPVQVGETYVVVGSRGGDDEHPAWILNVRDDPRVTVVIGGRAPEARLARVADPQERATLWPRVAGRYPNYAGYQRRTSREIPLVLLERLP